MLLIGLFPMTAHAAEVASGTCGENLTWTLADGVLTISGTGDMDDHKSELAEPWFDYATGIESVVIDSGVTSIGSYAFSYCTSLTEVTIPDGVVSIGGYASITMQNQSRRSPAGSIRTAPGTSTRTTPL